MSCGENISLLSANCQGSQCYEKMYDIRNYFKKLNYDILCLQDTHWTEKNSPQVRKIWGGECILNGNKTNARGVAILFSNKIEYKIHNVHKDNDGNLLIIDLKLSEYEIKLINVYCPNKDTPLFFENINEIIESNTQEYVLLCGDLNLVLDPNKDYYNYTNQNNNPKSCAIIKQSIKQNNLIDVFRYFNCDKIRYTWRRKNPIRQARLDYWITSNTFSDMINSCDIIPGYRSDHSQVKLTISLNKFIMGKGVWKFNSNLLKYPDYLTVINNVIKNEIERYALPVYSHEFLTNEENYKTIVFNIDDDLFLETLLLKIRGETIKFSSKLSSEKCILENILIEEINKLENQSFNSVTANILEIKKSELEEIRKEKMKGHAIRARLEYLTEGERATQYFCSLENKNYIEKTVKKLTLTNNKIITDQKKILTEMKLFYKELFRNHDENLSNLDLDVMLNGYELTKLNENDQKLLSGKLTDSEITNTLSKMKNNKSPGIDGFSAEFF